MFNAFYPVLNAVFSALMQANCNKTIISPDIITLYHIEASHVSVTAAQAMHDREQTKVYSFHAKQTVFCSVRCVIVNASAAVFSFHGSSFGFFDVKIPLILLGSCYF